MKTGAYLFFIIIALMPFNYGYGQSYGLGFYSHEVVQDQRTGLDLSPNTTLCFKEDFEVSFDMTFLPDREDYFGYILRFVQGDEQNIDLIYDLNEKKHFRIIVGDKFSKVSFNIPPEKLYSTWNKIKIKFDYQHNLLTLSSGTYTYSTQFSIDKGNCFKILFGANEYKGFKTADIPPMKIRNIQILENGKQKFFWPLNEYNGNVAKEQVSGSPASVIKPLWIIKMHHEWQLLKSKVVKGPASVTFDDDKEMVHVIASDSLQSYSVRANKFSAVAYKNQLNLLRGNQSSYDGGKNRILNVYPDQKAVSIFDFSSGLWSRNFDLATPITDYWQYNRFYSPSDTSLYVLGGYGHFIYKNGIQKYNIPRNKWEKLHVAGDTYTPRYLAALGFNGNGAYLLGGYGSTTGKQMLNPRNLYDLLYFDVKKKTLKQVYKLKIQGEDFVFANSMVINEKTKKYYALVFPRHKYKSNLQLIEGSLSKPEYKLTGSQIPYLFHDINSYADLYYCKSSKKFIAVTTFRNEDNQTTVNIYALFSPPLALSVGEAKEKTGMGYFFVALGAVALGIGTWIYLRSKNKPAVIREPVTQDKPEEKPPVTEAQEPMKKSAVYLFGDLQVFNQEGIEITKQFTPLIKELFLVILLYTIRWERGISSDKLKELLWFDKSAESARNNRSVNIAKLKSILEKVNNCQITKETGYWRISLDESLTYIDYQQYFKIIRDKTLSRDKIKGLAEIIKRGSFLSTVNYEWMDSFKAEISNEIIDTYLQFARSADISSDPELLIELANYIFYFDSVNEEAMIIKCKALVYLGKHSLAKNTFENFCKEYKVLYNDDFDKSFNDILHLDSSNL